MWAGVHRVFKDKPGGLVVDYLGLADELKKALITYTESGGNGKTASYFWKPIRGRWATGQLRSRPGRF